VQQVEGVRGRELNGSEQTRYWQDTGGRRP
jgi:hypothetical protein